MPWATGGGPSLQVGPGTKLHPYTPSPSNYRAVGCSRDMCPFWTTVSPLTKQKRPDWTVQFDEQFSKSKHTHVQRHGKTMAPCSRDSHTGLHIPLLMPHMLGLHPLLTAVRILCLAIFLAGQRIVSVPAHLLTIHQGQVRLPVTPEPPFTPNWAGHLPAESSFRFSRHLNFAE